MFSLQYASWASLRASSEYIVTLECLSLDRKAFFLSISMTWMINALALESNVIGYYGLSETLIDLCFLHFGQFLNDKQMNYI